MSDIIPATVVEETSAAWPRYIVQHQCSDGWCVNVVESYIEDAKKRVTAAISTGKYRRSRLIDTAPEPATVVGDGPVPDTSMCDRIKCPACGLTAYMDPGPRVRELVAAASEFRKVMGLGPLDFAAMYGDAVDPRDIELGVATRLDAALEPFAEAK